MLGSVGEPQELLAFDAGGLLVIAVTPKVSHDDTAVLRVKTQGRDHGFGKYPVESVMFGNRGVAVLDSEEQFGSSQAPTD